jgi:membrane protein implicated in regulation of membrane protease activity
MTVLGLILVLLAGSAVAMAVMEPDGTFLLFGTAFAVGHLEMFAAGAAACAVLVLGLLLMGAGSRRSARHRRQVRESRVEAARLKGEKRDLQRRLEREDTPVAGTPPDAGDPASGGTSRAPEDSRA